MKIINEGCAVLILYFSEQIYKYMMHGNFKQIYSMVKFPINQNNYTWYFEINLNC